MMNKIFVFCGIGVGAILIVENFVAEKSAYVFIDSNSKAWFLSFISIILGIFIGYGLKGILIKGSSEEEDNYDF